MRWLRHLFDFGTVRRRFPPAILDAIRQAIAASEAAHLGEIVFAVEGSLPLAALRRGLTPRERAQAVFAELRVWDTAHNSGVLIYLLLADQAIEIVADRGIADRVGDDEWRDVCELMRGPFVRGEYAAGAQAGIAAVTAILRRHLPADGLGNPDERPDRPVLL
jgi:uncharacterized membrane protein